MSLEKTVVSEIPKFILPFSEKVNASDKFDKDVATEVAAIFALAEMDREKGGRILSRHSSEKINFIAKIGYPFWLCPLLRQSCSFRWLKLIRACFLLY